MGGTAKRIGTGIATGGLSEFAQKDPYGAPLPFKNPIRSGIQGVLGLSGDSTQNPSIPGPFSIDRDQLASDKADILGLGNKQYEDTLGALGNVRASNTQRAKDLFSQMLPNIAENANAAHLYDSTGYGQEVARQQSGIASQLLDQESQGQLSALSGRQGFETGALQRGQSLEDFINQANVAKTMGAQMAPPPPSGKQNFGTVAQGVGALAPWAKVGKAAV